MQAIFLGSLTGLAPKLVVSMKQMNVLQMAESQVLIIIFMHYPMRKYQFLLTYFDTFYIILHWERCLKVPHIFP